MLVNSNSSSWVSPSSMACATQPQSHSFALESALRLQEEAEVWSIDSNCLK